MKTLLLCFLTAAAFRPGPRSAPPRALTVARAWWKLDPYEVITTVMADDGLSEGDVAERIEELRAKTERQRIAALRELLAPEHRGTRVEAKRRAAKNLWYLGEVVAAHENGTFDVLHDGLALEHEHALPLLA